MTYPYLPPLNKVKKLPKYAKNISEVYTLVLDLDETLIHFEIDDNADDDDDGYYNIRPGALRFLSVLSEFFEIVVFTAAMPDVSLFTDLPTVLFSTPTGSWTISTGLIRSAIGSIDSTPLRMKTMPLRI